MLKGILAISGQPGLFKVISEGKNGVIVESLLTGKKETVYTSVKMSTLEDIAIYTFHEEVPLKEVFKKIYQKENASVSIDPKSSPDVLKKYFETVLPDFDKERVYQSDIKKIISWYNLLLEKNLLTELEKPESTEHSEIEE